MIKKMKVYVVDTVSIPDDQAMLNNIGTWEFCESEVREDTKYMAEEGKAYYKHELPTLIKCQANKLKDKVDNFVDTDGHREWIALIECANDILTLVKEITPCE